MSRTKDYRRSEVLNKAVPVFWKKGYDGASIGDLVKATKLNTFSMYREFGSKEGLFEEALETYHASVQHEATRPLRERPGINSLREFFNVLGGFVSTRGYAGCMIMNSLVEKERIGGSALARVQKYCDELAGLFELSLRTAQEKGDVPKSKDTKVLAHQLFCFAQGLTLYGRTNANKGMVGKMVASALSILD